MSQSQLHYADAFISVRLVVIDHYMAPPVDGLDPLVADHRGYDVRQVPVLRVFGSTPAGQNCCLHLHGIFPYLFVPMPEKEAKSKSDADGFVYRLCSSLDKAINMTLNQSKSRTQHVYKAVKVSGRPFYGYHPRQHTFVKLYFYNPFVVKRASDLLSGGAVMNQVLQPHESHVPFHLQFMMDYNLQGMNPIHLRHAVFRPGSLVDEYDDIEPFFRDVLDQRPADNPQPPLSPGDSFSGSGATPESPHSAFLREAPDRRQFRPESLPESLVLKHAPRISTSELELDAVAADILNHNDLSAGGMNPGLKSLWEDERERRRQLDVADPLTPPGSPPRDRRAYDKTESEQFWYDRLVKIIEEKDSSDAGSADVPSSDDPDATANIGRLSAAYPAETPDSEVPSLPEATQLEPHVPTLSQSLFCPSFLDSSSSQKKEDEDDDDSEDSDYNMADDTIVDEEVVASQIQSSFSGEDRELVDLLADLADHAGGGEEEDSDGVIEKGEKSKSDPRSGRSPSQSINSGAASSASDMFANQNDQANNEEDEIENLEMSQIIWDSDPFTSSSQEEKAHDSSLWGDDLSNSLLAALDIDDIEDLR